MKRLLWLLLLLTACANAQVVGAGFVEYVTSAPSGTCSQGARQQNVLGSGDVWTCQSGTWTIVGGGSGGNAATLEGKTWEAPGTIGSTTPNSGVFTTLGGKVVNGVGHSELYPGATLDVRVNACIIDAETHANGNTSGVCDSTGEAVTQTIAAQMNIGDVSFDPVEWRLPPKCLWSTSNAFTGGTDVAILQYAGTKISGGGAQEACIIENNSGTNRMKALYLNSGDGYYEAGGFKIRNRSFTFASNGPTMWIQYGYDNSYFHDIEVQNYMASGPGIMVGNNAVLDNTPCCTFTFARVTSYGNNTGGIPLDIEALTGVGNPNGLEFFGLSLGHPAAGQPLLKINNTYSAPSFSAYHFYGLYEEGNTADTTTAFNQISSAGSSIIFSGVEIKAGTATSTAAAFSLSGSAITFSLDALSMPFNFTLPATAVLNNITTLSTATDSNGNLASYRTALNVEGRVSANVLGLVGATSGTATITAPAAAGTTTNPFALTNAVQIPTGTAYQWSTDTFLSRISGGKIAAGQTTGALNGIFAAAQFLNSGTTFAASGCSNGTLLGGASAGSFVTGASGACSITITMGSGTTATHGWACDAKDHTTTAGNPINQTGAASTTTATFALPAGNVSGDFVTFSCMAY